MKEKQRENLLLIHQIESAVSDVAVFTEITLSFYSSSKLFANVLSLVDINLS